MTPSKGRYTATGECNERPGARPDRRSNVRPGKPKRPLSHFSPGSGDAAREGPPVALGADETMPLAEDVGDNVGEHREVSVEQPGRYRAKDEVGRGALGRVFVAYDHHVGRDIAIKELLPSVSGEAADALWGPKFSRDINARFLREARVTGQLEHPSVMPVYEIGRRDDGTLYYAMRLVRGRSLAVAIEEAQSPRQRLLLLPHYRDICNAIAYAHSRGVIHRDIKPENVMIGEFGETVVLDWGLAKLKGQPDQGEETLERGLQRLKEVDGGRTIDGAAMGTPHYMPPEQARGQLSEIDHQSDIYSLGAVLYEILAGVPPYEDQDALGVITQVLTTDPPPIPAREPTAPTELVAVAHKAISRKKEDRYATAAALSADVGAYMSGERVGAYDYTSWEVLWRFVRKHVAAVSAVGIVIAALVATAVFSSVYYSRERSARKEEIRAKHRAEAVSAKLERAMGKEVAQRRKAQYRLSQALVEKGLGEERAQRYSAARIYAAAALINNPAYPKSPYHTPTFATLNPASVDLRVRAISLLFRTAHHPSLRLRGVTLAGPRQQWQAISEAAQLAASVKPDGSVMLWRFGARKPTQTLAGHSGGVWQADFSPSGDALVTAGRDGYARIWSTRTGMQQARLRLPKGKCRTASWSPAATHIALSSGHGDVYLWNVKTRAFGRRLPGRGSVVFHQSWSSDGKLLAVVTYDKILRIWTLAKGEHIELPRRVGGYHSAAFSPDGSRLVTTNWDRELILWSTRPYRIIRPLPGHLGPVLGLAFTPDGKSLVSGGFDRQLMVWDVASGVRRLALGAHAERIRKIHVYDRGRQLASMAWDRTVKTWDMVSARPPIAVSGHTDYVTFVKYSPDDKHFVTASSDRTVRLWDASTGRPVRTLVGHTKQVDAVVWTPDGKRIVSASRDRTVRLWDPVTGAQTNVLSGHQARINSVVVSHDGRWIASADHHGQVCIWNRRTGQLIRALQAHKSHAWQVAFSPDDRRLATAGGDQLVKVWQTGSWRLLRTLRGHTDWVSGAHFSPDGRLLATAGKDRQTILWDLQTGRPLHRVTGHGAWTNRVIFSRDGRLFVTASDDHSIRIWSVKTGEPLLIIRASRSVPSVDIAADSRTIIMADDRRVRIIKVDLASLDVDPRVVLRQAEKAAGLKLTGFQLTPSHGK